ncbi:MAG: maleylpyruvate isomerase N-terminal domain-containing protein [Propionibacteriaceae bacterium]
MTAQDALEASYLAVIDALEDVDDGLASAPTRCAGWVVQDLVHHLLSDAQRALVALHTPAASGVDTDAVSYWLAFRPDPTRVDPALNHTRVMAGEWSFRSLVSAYAETAHAAITASNERAGAEVVTTQGRVLTVDSLRSTLAVEATVHLLDLRLGEPSAQGLAEVRRVLDGLLGQPAAISDDARYALLGTGRDRPNANEEAILGDRAGRLPLFG